MYYSGMAAAGFESLPESQGQSVWALVDCLIAKLSLERGSAV